MPPQLRSQTASQSRVSNGTGTKENNGVSKNKNQNDQKKKNAILAKKFEDLENNPGAMAGQLTVEGLPTPDPTPEPDAMDAEPTTEADTSLHSIPEEAPSGHAAAPQPVPTPSEMNMSQADVARPSVEGTATSRPAPKAGSPAAKEEYKALGSDESDEDAAIKEKQRISAIKQGYETDYGYIVSLIPLGKKKDRGRVWLSRVTENMECGKLEPASAIHEKFGELSKTVREVFPYQDLEQMEARGADQIARYVYNVRVDSQPRYGVKGQPLFGPRYVIVEMKSGEYVVCSKSTLCQLRPARYFNTDIEKANFHSATRKARFLSALKNGENPEKRGEPISPSAPKWLQKSSTPFSTKVKKSKPVTLEEAEEAAMREERIAAGEDLNDDDEEKEAGLAEDERRRLGRNTDSLDPESRDPN